jgi:hypothetical protein
VSSDRLPFDETLLKEKLKNDPSNWEARRQLSHGLYDKQAYLEAADTVWNADEIPSTDLDLAFAIRILAKAHPRRAIRLITAVLELNRGKGVQNLGMANALLHHGMVLQAARFYGAALDADPTLVNPDLEHFILWSDDECTMWDIFKKHRPKLGELPWMVRDPKEALRLTARVSLHTTPIAVPALPIAAGEDLKHELYQQEAKKNGKITPPPAVTIPIDQVNPKDRLFDADYGASVVNKSESKAAPAEAKSPAPATTPEKPESTAPPSNEESPSMVRTVKFPAFTPTAHPVPQVISEEDGQSSPVAPQEAVPDLVPTKPRSLLPSGSPTGAPTRALLPSGTPPTAGAPRRLLVTPPLNTPKQEE